MALAVGFDLDMTLVDSAAGIVATQHAVMSGRGVDVAPQVLRDEVGVPVELLFARWLPAADVDRAVEEYRRSYLDVGVTSVTALPGAGAALSALRASSVRTVVVSAKPAEVVTVVLDHVGLTVDVVVGGLFAGDKAVALREHGVSVYVGDHPGDMAGALAAGATGVGVTTGSFDAEALRAAGATDVLAGLDELADWLTRRA